MFCPNFAVIKQKKHIMVSLYRRTANTISNNPSHSRSYCHCTVTVDSSIWMIFSGYTTIPTYCAYKEKPSLQQCLIFRFSGQSCVKVYRSNIWEDVENNCCFDCSTRSRQICSIRSCNGRCYRVWVRFSWWFCYTKTSKKIVFWRRSNCWNNEICYMASIYHRYLIYTR